MALFVKSTSLVYSLLSSIRAIKLDDTMCALGLKDFISCRVGWGKMSMVGHSRLLGILFCMPKIKESMVKRSTFLFFHWNMKSSIDGPAITNSLAFTLETKTWSDSLCPTILILPHPTLQDVVIVRLSHSLIQLCQVVCTTMNNHMRGLFSC